MIRTLRGFVASFTLSFIVFAPLIWAADHAQAATVTIEFTGEDFYIPRPATASDQENVERLLASYDLAANGHADLIGQECSVAGTSANGESVHPANYGMLRSNGDSVRISGTEDEANGVRLSDRTIVLGATVDLFNVMVPDPDGIVATSVTYTVRVTCTDDTTTTSSTSSTTTIPQTTTTTAPRSSSTTTPGSTTTTSPATTTTAPTDSTTSTTPSTIPPGSSTSTTAPTDSTSTSIITGSTVTTVPPVTGSTLPLTGPADVAGLVMAGLALLALGGGLVVAGREGR